MTPADAIAALDRQIAMHGEPIAFLRGSTVTIARGFIRGYRPEQLVGLITVKDRQVTLSPTGLGSYEPREQDQFSASGQLGVVMAAEPIRIDGVLVRWNLSVRIN